MEQIVVMVVKVFFDVAFAKIICIHVDLKKIVLLIKTNEISVVFVV
jgi:hypothetical protein